MAYSEDYYDDEDSDYYRDELDDFADPGGNSALRAESPTNPRNLPCPTCRWPNRLTPKDRALGYQCDSCANALEQGRDINYYEPEGDEEDDDGDSEIIEGTC